MEPIYILSNAFLSILQLVVQELSVNEVFALYQTCKSLKSALEKMDFFWKRLLINHFANRDNPNKGDNYFLKFQRLRQSTIENVYKGHCSVSTLPLKIPNYRKMQLRIR